MTEKAKPVDIEEVVDNSEVLENKENTKPEVTPEEQAEIDQRALIEDMRAQVNAYDKEMREKDNIKFGIQIVKDLNDFSDERKGQFYAQLVRCGFFQMIQEDMERQAAAQAQQEEQS